MLIIRPTASLARRLGIRVHPTAETSSTVLGDWYANTVTIERKPFILCVSSKTRLPVILPAAPFASFAERLPQALGALLIQLGIPSRSVVDELARMAEVTFAKTDSKSLLGTMNEYKLHAQWDVEDDGYAPGDEMRIAFRLSEMPSSGMSEVWPQDAVYKAFGVPELLKKVVPLHLN